MPEPDWLRQARERGLVIAEGPPARVPVADTPPVGLSEDEFLGRVIDLAHGHGWKLIHVRPARTAKGWRTAVSGDGKGFPDVLMIHPPTGRQVVAELKIGTNEPTAEQRQWLEWFRAVGVPAFVWRPESWSDIVRELTR